MSRNIYAAIPLLLLVVAAFLPLGAGGTAQEPVSETPGLVVERIRLPRAPTAGVGNQILTLVRVDLRRYAFRFLSEGHEGERRPLTQWVEDQGLTGGINAGMFLPNGRSVGFMMSQGQVRSDRTPGSFSGVLAFDPLRGASPIGIGGRGCSQNLDWFRGNYSSVLQARRLLINCRGRVHRWPNRRRYSAAAFGVDENGWAVLVHSRTPYRMSVFSEMLVSLDLGIRGLVYMEGGPEASLVVNAGRTRVREIGSWEDGFNRNDDNRVFWDLPNIIGFEPRSAP